MPILIERPTRVEAAGTPPKLIDEFVGRVNTGNDRLSIAHMRSPAGWAEPGQTPEFDEYTLILHGVMRVEHRGGVLEVRPGQAVLTTAGEWVRSQHARRGGVHFGLPAGILADDGASGRMTGDHLLTLYAATYGPYGWLVTPFRDEPVNAGGDARIVTFTIPVWPAFKTPAWTAAVASCESVV